MRYWQNLLNLWQIIYYFLYSFCPLPRKIFFKKWERSQRSTEENSIFLLWKTAKGYQWMPENFFNWNWGHSKLISKVAWSINLSVCLMIWNRTELTNMPGAIWMGRLRTTNGASEVYDPNHTTYIWHSTISLNSADRSIRLGGRTELKFRSALCLSEGSEICCDLHPHNSCTTTKTKRSKSWEQKRWFFSPSCNWMCNLKSHMRLILGFHETPSRKQKIPFYMDSLAHLLKISGAKAFPYSPTSLRWLFLSLGSRA